MCGIAGILCPDMEQMENIEGRLLDMKGSLRHRGPDDEETYLDRKNGVGLAHTRLSILDLSAAGHQPMQDGLSWLTYNGEIYNYRLLRSELEDDPDRWNSESDTEVILRGYRRWGVSFLSRLRGMFGLALWDADARELLLARDPFGIKPLYYYSTDGLFLFASEVRALLASGLVQRRLSPEGLATYLQYGSVAEPYTMVDEVRSVPPGHYLKVKARGRDIQIEQVSFADRPFTDTEPCVESREEALEALRAKLEESVRLHMVSDVPVAAFLSGGVDSSAIVALMSQVSQEKPRTFTVVFAESDFSEQSYAHLVSHKFGTIHQDVPISEQDLLRTLPSALAAMDQPTMDGVNTHAISKAVRDAGITVALSGLGGDELFAGYPSFRRAMRLQALAALPSSVSRVVGRAGQAILGGSVPRRKAWDLIAAGGGPLSVYEISRRLFAPEEISGLVSPEIESFSLRDRARVMFGPSTDFQPDRADPLNAVSRYEMQGYLVNTLLRDTDQMSMAHSLEARVPFVDVDVASCVLSLPGKWKIEAARPKPLLLDAMDGLIPEEVWRRPKMGFTLPFEKWMRSCLKPRIDKAFAEEIVFEKIGITGVARTVWDRFSRQPRLEKWSRPWALYVLKNWCELNQVYL